MSDEEQARAFRLEVKKRLFGPYRVRFQSSQPPFGPHCGESECAYQRIFRLSDLLNYYTI